MKNSLIEKYGLEAFFTQNTYNLKKELLESGEDPKEIEQLLDKEEVEECMTSGGVAAFAPERVVSADELDKTKEK